jgi:hypothetical protein
MRKKLAVSKTTHYRRIRQAKELGCIVEQLPDNRGKHGMVPMASDNYRWNKGKLLTKDGYVLVRIGKSHPLADQNGYIKEHLLVVISSRSPGAWLLEHGKCNWVVHHKNGDRTDNRIENLEVIKAGDHNKIHNKTDRSRGGDGRFVGKKTAGSRLDGQTWEQLP